MPTTMFVGSEMRIRPIIVHQPDGTGKIELANATMRTDMWEPWLVEAIVAAHEAVQAASKIPSAKACGNLEDIGGSMMSELRAAMRTVTSCSFAFDALYASTKGRAAAHPDQAAWEANGTARPIQIAETFRYHMRLGHDEARQVRDLLHRTFFLRDAAVHPSASFRQVIYRDDLDAQVDWHYGTFRAEAAANVATGTVASFGILVGAMPRAKGELREYAELANRVLEPVRGLARRAGFSV